jgi:hypothetical protein
VLSSASRAVTQLSDAGLVVATGFSAIAIGLLTKVLFRLPILPDQVQIADYGVVMGIAPLVLGLLAADTRGILLAGIGAAISALSAISVLASAHIRLDMLAYGLPLAFLGGPGLALFAHGTLHPSPALARRGIDLAARGLAGTVIAAAAIELLLIVRAKLHGTGLGTLLVVGVAVLCAAVVLWALAHGRKPHTGQT